MTAMVVRAALALALVGVAGCQTARAPEAAVMAQPMTGELASSAERTGASNVVAAVLRDGHILQMWSWGADDCAGNGVVNPEASYEIGSISKQITATAVMQLWEQGRINLDAPVGQYLPDIPDIWKRVTIRQLLTHTSGVPDYEEAGGYGVYETEPTPQQVFAIVADRPLDFEPGTRWSYSNTGYFLLSLVVQQVSGERFGDYLRNHIFAPLHMEHSFMGGYAPADAVLAHGCRPGENGARIPVRPIVEASTFGAGGISSTLRDWALWDDALFSGRILSPRAMALMTTTQHLADGADTGYGFGLFVDEFRGERRIDHSGQTQGFVAEYEYYPDRNLSIIVFTNRYQAGVTGVARALTIQAIPELSYDRLQSPASDPDPARTAWLRRALRQVTFSQAPLDLLSPDMQSAATSAQFAESREILRPFAEHADELVYLRSDPPDGEYERHIYRSVLDGETWYLALTTHAGVLAGITRTAE